MSYILEALKKSDAERKRGEVPTLSDAPQAPSADNPKGTKPWVWILAGGFGAVALAGVATMALMGGEDAPMAEAPQPAQVAQVEPEPAPKPEPKPEPAPEPVAEPVAEPTLEPTPEPVAEPTADPMPDPQEVRVLQTQTPPEPKVETQVPTINKPVTIVEAAPPVKTVAKSKSKSPTRPAMPELRNAAAYVSRAWVSMDKGLYAQAIDDLDRAVDLEPNFADAWFAHGWANEKIGDERAAVQDYGRTIDAKPDHAFALFSRGFLNLYGGKTRAAVVDFVRTQGVATDDSLRLYSRLWLYLSRSRSGQNARDGLKEGAARESLAVWPGPLVLHFIGALDEGGVVTAIENGPKAGLKERRATGYFFLGISKLERKNTSRARAYFEKALATGAVEFRQYDAARRELERLDR